MWQLPCKKGSSKAATSITSTSAVSNAASLRHEWQSDRVLPNARGSPLWVTLCSGLNLAEIVDGVAGEPEIERRRSWLLVISI